MTKEGDRFLKVVNNPLRFRIFLARSLPAAWFSGVRVREVNAERAVVTIPFKWFTRNPFRSTYFASLAMAAEMSTGVLAMASVFKRKPAIALLVVAIEAKFYKKATGKTKFICEEGKNIRDTVEKAATGEAQTIRVLSAGYNENKELVAEFWVTWSFRRRRS